MLFGVGDYGKVVGNLAVIGDEAEFRLESGAFWDADEEFSIVGHVLTCRAVDFNSREDVDVFHCNGKEITGLEVVFGEESNVRYVAEYRFVHTQ